MAGPTPAFAIKAAVGEGILWCDRTAALWWVDIPAGRLFRSDPSDGATRHWDMGEPLGCIALTDGHDLVLGLQSGFARFDPATGKRTALIDPEPDKPQNRLNDGAVSRDGRFLAGTIPLGDRSHPAGAIYRLDPDLTCRKVIDGLHVPNGLAFSPDNTTLYVSDSWPDVRMIWRCAYDAASGTIGPRRPFFDTRAVAGRPDGACVDADGCYWMAGVGGAELVRITPDGKVDTRIALPVARPSKPCFGGARLDTLYVTSIGTGSAEDAPDGQIIEVPCSVTGLPEPRMTLPPC